LRESVYTVARRYCIQGRSYKLSLRLSSLYFPLVLDGADLEQNSRTGKQNRKIRHPLQK